MFSYFLSKSVQKIRPLVLVRDALNKGCKLSASPGISLKFIIAITVQYNFKLEREPSFDFLNKIRVKAHSDEPRKTQWTSSL